MKELLFNNQLFGIVLCCAAFLVGQWLNRKAKGNVLVNPLLISIVLCVVLLLALDLPLEWFNKGGDIINLLLLPATALLGVSIYNQRRILKQNFWPVIIGCLVGCLASAGSVTALCHLFGLNEALTASLLPKSVTTPIAVALSQQLGGVPSITVAMVLITGVVGAVLAPVLAKLLKMQDPVQVGAAIGASSHALGTSVALTLGEVQGAVSSVSIGVCGLMTVALALFW